jgi:FkbM family methyltransferase
MAEVADFSAKFDEDRRCLAQLRKIGIAPKHFFDIGACNGSWTRHIGLDFPEATFDMFEPLTDHAPALRERLEPTADGVKRRLHRVALGPESKQTRMFMYPDNLAGSTALELGYSPENANAVEIQMLRLDDAIPKLGLPVPNFIKMDTQGCELTILEGARQTLPHVDVLLLECWLTRAYGPKTPLLLEIGDWVRQFDFHLWELADHWRDEAGNLVAQDCFFVNARCQASPLHKELQQASKEAETQNTQTQSATWRKKLGRLLGS